jgi:hypothetical protein
MRVLTDVDEIDAGLIVHLPAQPCLALSRFTALAPDLAGEPASWF